MVLHRLILCLDLCQHQLPPNDGQHQDGRSELQCTMVLHLISYGLILVSTNFHQMTDNIKMAVISCNVQWCFTGIHGLILVSTNFHQMTDNIKMAGLSCNEQWCCTLISMCLDLCQHQLPPNDGQHQDGRSELQ